MNINSFANEPETENESWLSNGLHRFIIAFSVMWFGIIVVYLTNPGWAT